jgi:hypothetical protein
MQTQSYPKQLTTPASAVPAQEPALHLLGGIWIASCPSYGYQLTTARTQELASSGPAFGVARSAERTPEPRALREQHPGNQPRAPLSC